MEDKKFQAAAILTSISYSKDGGMRLGFTTNELSDEDKLIAAKFYQKFGFVLFKSNEFSTTEIPREEAEEGHKTPGQRLRGVLFRKWKQEGVTTDFEVWYRGEMEKFIEKVKSQLDVD